MNEENKMIKDVALDWLQYGDRWDEIKSEMALKYISSLKAENARYREALLKIKIMTDDPNSMLYHVAKGALKE